MGARIGVSQVHTRTVDFESSPYNNSLGPEFYKSKNQKKYSKNTFQKPEQTLSEKSKKESDESEYSEALGPEWYR